MDPSQSHLLRSVDDTARNIAKSLLAEARHGALATICDESGVPMATRVAVATDSVGRPITLISELAHHTLNLQARAECSLLVGEPGPKGDALTHPRLTLQAVAEQADKDALKPLYLSQHPKATLYFDFADFLMMRLTVSTGLLNAGFGKAYRLSPVDLGLMQ